MQLVCEVLFGTGWLLTECHLIKIVVGIFEKREKNDKLTSHGIAIEAGL
jgi:hypothetical protein